MLAPLNVLILLILLILGVCSLSGWAAGSPQAASSQIAPTQALSDGFKIITDATHTQFRIREHPQRIIPLSPALAELAADLLQNDLDRIIGVTDFTDYPPNLKKVPSLGPFNRVNLEKIAGLKPDLILATLDGNAKDQIQHLRELGIPTVVIVTGSLQEIRESMELVGNALGFPERGAQAAKQFQTGVDRIRSKSKLQAGPKGQNPPVPRVLLQVGEDPIVIAGQGSFLSEALEVVGAQNVYADSPTRYPRPSIEDILYRNPDLILILEMGMNPKLAQSAARRWSEFPRLKAVQSKKVKILRSDALLRPSLRLLEGLSTLESLVHASQ